MRISRVSTGFIMIGISIFLCLSALLADDSEMRVAELAFIENFLAVIAVALMVFGIYLAAFSKACPVCVKKSLVGRVTVNYAAMFLKPAHMYQIKPRRYSLPLVAFLKRHVGRRCTLDRQICR
jgi:hypothetical protein